jgi:predicted unusual protein kinase regulating ubiquinone biosynthesis (AarF/ABC1/UbiB family)
MVLFTTFEQTKFRPCKLNLDRTVYTVSRNIRYSSKSLNTWDPHAPMARSWSRTHVLTKKTEHKTHKKNKKTHQQQIPDCQDSVVARGGRWAKRTTSYQLAGKGKAIYSIRGNQYPVVNPRKVTLNYAASISSTLTSFIINNKYI